MYQGTDDLSDGRVGVHWYTVLVTTLVAAWALLLSPAYGQAPGPITPPRTVEAVDLARYAGTYYEIARFPNRFQKQCAGDVTATYTIQPDGRISVINRCRREDGSIDEARGVVRQAGNDTSNAKLEVRLAPAWLSFLPQVWGDYWILTVGPDYSYALVGSPSRDYLWILSRVPQMPDLAYRQAVEVAKANGYDISRLVKTGLGS